MSSGLEIVDVGTVVSMVQVDDAGDASVLPAASLALTWNVWLPSAKLEYDLGLVHAANESESNLHSDNVTAVPVPSAVNAILIEFEFVEPPGATALLLPSVAPVMVVIGLIVSMVQVDDAGDASVLPAASVALTWNV